MKRKKLPWYYKVGLFLLIIVFYNIILSVIEKKVPSYVFFVLVIIGAIAFWSFIELKYRHTTLQRKVENSLSEGVGRFIKYFGYMGFLIGIIGAVYAFFNVEETKRLMIFWLLVFLGLLQIPIFYLIGWIILKIEKSKWFKTRGESFKLVLLFPIVLTLFVVVLGLLVTTIGSLARHPGFPEPYGVYLLEMIEILPFTFMIFLFLGVAAWLFAKIVSTVSDLFGRPGKK